MKHIIYFLFLLVSFAYAKEEPITLQLQWKHQFQFAGYYMAKEKGFYKDKNLDVTLLEYKLGTNTLNELLSHKIDYAIGRSSLINQRSIGKRIVLLTSILQSSPLSLITQKNITLDTLKNKRLTITGNEAESAIFPLLLSNNIIKHKLEIVKSKTKINDFISKKTEAITAYSSNQEYKLIQNNISYNIFNPKDYGFDFYDDILYTTEETTLKNKQQAIDFTAASIKGWQYAFSNIEETIDVILKNYNTQKKTREELSYEAHILKKLAFKEKIPLGNITHSKIQRIYDIYNVMGLTEKPINIEEFIFNTQNNNLGQATKKLDLYTQEEKEYLKSHKTIKMCNNANWEPIEFAKYNDFNDMSGIAIDTIKKIGKNLSITFQNIPTSSWVQSQQFLKEKKCDILPSAVKTKQREEYANFTDPYLQLPLAIFTAKEKPLVNGISEVIDKKWSRKNGSGLIQKINSKYPNNNLIQTKTTSEAFQLVNNGKVYFTIATLPVASNYISKYRLDNLQIAGYSDIVYNLSIAVRKDDLILRGILDKELKNIPMETHNKILKKWIANDEKSFFDYKTIRNIFILFFLFALLLFYRQYLLKKNNANLKQLVDEKTKELKELNQNLEIRIERAIIKNREQDKVLNSQAKMASMGEMIGNIAHQWRQPLSVISTGVTGMQIQKEFDLLDDEKFEQTCNIINSNVQYLSKTIDDFKNFIKGDRIKHTFKLLDNVNTFVNLMEGSVKKEDIKLLINIDSSLQIDGYDNELVQCFINIFNNAKDALQSVRKKDKLIIISAEQKEEKILIYIQDNAQGVDENIIHKIFEPYFTTKHKYQGTGLGLHMTYKLIVDGMKGDITVKNTVFTHNNEEYYGAKFQITLPIS